MVFYDSQTNTYYSVDTPEHIVDFLADVDPELKTYKGEQVTDSFYRDLFFKNLFNNRVTTPRLILSTGRHILHPTFTPHILFPDVAKDVAYSCRIKFNRRVAINAPPGGGMTFYDVSVSPIALYKYTEFRLRSKLL